MNEGMEGADSLPASVGRSEMQMMFKGLVVLLVLLAEPRHVRAKSVPVWGFADTVGSVFLTDDCSKAVAIAKQGLPSWQPPILQFYLEDQEGQPGTKPLFAFTNGRDRLYSLNSDVGDPSYKQAGIVGYAYDKQTGGRTGLFQFVSNNDGIHHFNTDYNLGIWLRVRNLAHVDQGHRYAFSNSGLLAYVNPLVHENLSCDPRKSYPYPPQTMTRCLGSPIPENYVVLGQGHALVCIKTNHDDFDTINSMNLEYAPSYDVGTTFTVCATSGIPSGWSAIRHYVAISIQCSGLTQHSSLREIERFW